MHRTIVLKKIIILFVLAFFCPANIYRPSLGKLWLDRPNPKLWEVVPNNIRVANLQLTKKHDFLLLQVGDPFKVKF